MEAGHIQGAQRTRDLGRDGEGVQAAASPCVSATREQLDGDAPLDASKRTPYRAVVARANYLASDRQELQFLAKEVCRWMSSPTDVSLAALKRLGRYVHDHRRLVYHHPWQTVSRVDTYSDTDWAGCVKTRKSTSGGCTMLGQHLIKSWSSTQASVSLSSGESEFYAAIKGAAVLLGAQSLARDLGKEFKARLGTDSSAAKGMCGRRGLGAVRHLETQYLWIQQAVRLRRVDLRQVAGDVNPADLFTKHSLTRERLIGLTKLFELEYRGGRAESAPQTRSSTSGKTTMAELMSVDIAPGS